MHGWLDLIRNEEDRDKIRRLEGLAGAGWESE